MGDCGRCRLAKENASRPVSRVLYGLGPCGPRRGSHSSGPRIAARLKQPTRMINPGKRAGLAPCVIPIRSCSRWGLPCRFRCRSRGGLLPHPFTLTPPPHCRMKRKAHLRQSGGGAVCFLWHFPWGRPRRTLSGTVYPWSPDFPHPAAFRRLQAAAARPTGAPLLDHDAGHGQTIAGSAEAMIN
jgi:hypothetical protein